VDFCSSGSGIPYKAESRIGDIDGWETAHNRMVLETQDAIREGREKLDILFLGDSITELYRGSTVGWKCDTEGQCQGAAEIWNLNFCELNTMAFGIKSDRTEHLLWRLENGEAEGLEPQLVVVLIGTNNFGDRATCNGSDDQAVLEEDLESFVDDVELGVMAVVTFLKRTMPAAQILVLALFPRGYPHDGELSNLFAWPNIYTAPFEQLNSRMQVAVDALNDDSGCCDDVGNCACSDNLAGVRKYGTLNCSDVFLLDNGNINPERLHDGIHPSADLYMQDDQLANAASNATSPAVAAALNLAAAENFVFSGYQLLLDKCLHPEFIRRGIRPTPPSVEEETVEESSDDASSLNDVLEHASQELGMLGTMGKDV